MTHPIPPRPPYLLEPLDPFRHGPVSTALDFWQFLAGDARTNNLRGYLAEFLVARAVGATTGRVEWDAYDVVTPTGVKVEVKTTGLVQAWGSVDGDATGQPGWRVSPTRHDLDSSMPPAFHADVYVFSLQTATRADAYDPLDVDQWRFYVVSRAALERLRRRTFTPRNLERDGFLPLEWSALAQAIAVSGSPIPDPLA